MPINTYVYGSQVRLEIDFVDQDNVAADPATVELIVVPNAGGAPEGAKATYRFGVGPVIVKEETGKYHADLTVSANGLWRWRWQGSGGAAQAATEGTFIVTSMVVKP